MSLSFLLRQSRRYASHGLGLGGSILKQSLVPLSVLQQVFPETGTILDIGCGEGMLGNLVAHALPGARILGIDKDAVKVKAAKANACPNASFLAADLFSYETSKAAGAIANDVLHHHTLERQELLLERIASWLEDGAVFVLKEVNAEDRADKAWTTFWDTRLYPEDKLSYRSRKDWENVLAAHGFRVLRVHRVRHFWPASRTVFICRYEPVRKNPTLPSGKLKALVTGATGFLGSYAIEHLQRQGIDGKPVEVTALVRSIKKTPRSIRETCPLIECDLRDLTAHASRLAEFDYVFHLAADKNFYGGKDVYENNIDTTRRLIQTLTGSPRLKRFVFASSMGAVDRAPDDFCRQPITEESKPSPSSWYGRAKMDSEKVIRDSGLPYSIIRLPWCYGPGMSAQTHVRALAEHVMKGSFITKFDWPGRISVMDAELAGQAFEIAAANPEAKGKALNVSDGSPIRFGDLFREMSEVAGGKAGQWRVPSLVVRLAFILRKRLPFTLKCLLMDVLWVDDKPIRKLGFKNSARSEGFLVPLVRFISLERRPALARSKWLVTGAASGIGRAISMQLAASGRSIVMVDKEAIADNEPHRPFGDSIKADLSDDRALAGLALQLEQDGVTGVVNCAGVAFSGRMETLSDQRLNLVLDVNVKALTSLSSAALKHFSQTGWGTLVNIASSAAFQPLADLATYSASKAYVLNFSEAIAAEALGTGVTVVTICPSGVASRFQQSAGVRVLENEKLLSPQDVSHQILRSAWKKKSKTLFIGRRTHAMALMARLLPRGLNARIWKRLMDKMR